MVDDGTAGFKPGALLTHQSRLGNRRDAIRAGEDHKIEMDKSFRFASR